MKISIICSSTDHPIYPCLLRWVEAQAPEHEIQLVQQQDALDSGDLLFLISCSDIIASAVRKKFSHSLVIHASDLPQGRGWSPHVWSILGGDTSIVVTLLEAEDAVDSGAIWQQTRLEIPRHALFDEINSQLFAAELELMSFAVANASIVKPVPQRTEGASYHPKRSPADSELDAEKSIAAQFDLLRVSDPNRYPAFFALHGHRYAIRLEKLDDD